MYNLPWRRESRVHQESCLEVHGNEWSHVEDVIVLEKEEIVGVVEAIYMVHLIIQQVPILVKLIYGQGWLDGAHARLQTDGYKAL